MIIGITGTLGAGKGTAAQYLAQKHNFVYYSVRNFIAEEVLRRGLLVNRDTITQVANDMRRVHGSDYVTRQLFVHVVKEQRSVVVESIRTVGEVECLRAHHGVLWNIEADQKLRFERASRMPDTSHLNFEQFVEREKTDEVSSDPSQRLSGVRALADLTIVNNGTKEEYYQKIEAALQGKS